MSLEEVRERFIRGAREGFVLNKWRRPYRPRAVDDLESLNQLPREMLRRPVDLVTPGEVQELVDELTRRGRSPSRVSSIVNALRSLYRFVGERELATHDPARGVRLPLGDPAVRDRVALPPSSTACSRRFGSRLPKRSRRGGGGIRAMP
jgi:hypothetical protein